MVDKPKEPKEGDTRKVNIKIEGLVEYEKFVSGRWIFHREDGPAIEYSDGYVEWYLNGLNHREDGPAIEMPGMFRTWQQHGIMHREDGAAFEDLKNPERNEYYIAGNLLTKEQFYTRISKLGKLLYD
jgi:hypothetical protein